MKRVLSFLVWAVPALLLVAVLVIFEVVPARIDASMNPVVPDPEAPAPSAAAAALHDTLLVADLHADALLWGRDSTRAQERGHTDFPRLRAGGTFLQVFSVVTKSPSGQNDVENSADAADQITPLVVVQRWPRRTYGSLKERARYQAERLRAWETKDENFRIIRSQADLRQALTDHETNPDLLVGVLATEGSHALEGDLGAIETLYNDGYRMMGLHHFFDNRLGGSLHGTSKAGLSDFGKAAVDKMVAMDIMIDVAHSSEAVVWDVLARTGRPLVVSHTGFKGACDRPRNISDELMIAIAERGGLIGVGYWQAAICDPTPDGVARMIRYGIDLVGEDAVALGSDFDGTVAVPFDASGLVQLTDALLRAGLTEAQITKVMGGNQIRFFLEHLAEGDAAL